MLQDYHSFQLTAGFQRLFHATTRALDVFTLHERLLLDIYHFRLPSNARFPAVKHTMPE